MKPRTLLRLYPRRWRERYGDEFVALLEREGAGPRVTLNVIAGAFDAWVSPRQQGQLAIDGSLGPWILARRQAEAEMQRYATRYWWYLGAAIGLGLAVHGIGQLVHPGRGFPLSFIAGFMAGLQFRNFRYFSLRTQLTAAFWALVITAGVTFVIHLALHRFVYPWFESALGHVK